MNELPEEEDYSSPSPESRMEAFAELLRAARQGTPWEPILDELLDAFERFLTEKPEPPASWSERLGSEASRYDYHQIVLPPDYLDPYKDDLENVQMLRDKFAGQKRFMSIENFLVTHNHFLFDNGHAAPVCIPRPLVMLESYTESKDVSWDCTLTVFPDGSWLAYNLDQDDEEGMGEDIADNLERWTPLLGHLRVVVPAEGRDYGWFNPGEYQ